MSPSVDHDLAFAHALADEADRVVQGEFVSSGVVEHEVKPDGTPVTAVDRAVEQALLELVRRERPDDAFLGEEVGAHGRSPRRWVVDGIDGTSDFIVGSPLWGTLIALMQDELPVLGLSTSLGQQRRWWASAGEGAWTAVLDDLDVGPARQMSVADAPDGRTPRAWIEQIPGHPTGEAITPLLGRVEHIDLTTHPGFMVAAGDLDLAVQIDGRAWDFAGVMPLVWEAGGRCLNLDGVDVRVPQEPIVYVGGMDPDEVRDSWPLEHVGYDQPVDSAEGSWLRSPSGIGGY